MKKAFPIHLIPNPLALLRKAGYAPFTDPKSGEDSYVLRLTADYYPRFHLYVEETPSEVTLSLHLDQKKPSYRGTAHKHSGDYDSPVVERELERLVRWVAVDSGVSLDEAKHEKDPEIENPPEKRSMFGGIF
ncbi:MAG: hypothetical protein WCT24_03000 [Patescibacteria group bacterium]|jgi:hypothetical protein